MTHQPPTRLPAREIRELDGEASAFPPVALLEALGRLYGLALLADRRGRVRWLSDAFSERCEDVARFLGKRADSLAPTAQRHALHTEFRARFAARGSFVGERFELELWGRQQPWDMSVLALDDESGARQCFLAIALPAAQAPRAPGSAGVRAEILESLPDAALVVEPSGCLSWASPRAAELLGRPPHELPGLPAAALFRDVEGLEALVDALGGAAVHDREIRIARGDGSEARAALSAGPLAGGGGTLLLLRDAALRQQYLEALRRTNAELEHCVNALAHDLRSPLVALLGFSRLLRQDYGAQLDETGEHFLDRIEQAGHTMEALVHNLLELSRIGKSGERPSPVDPRPVLVQLHAELKPRLEAEGIELDLPDDPPTVTCDRTRLYQVFSNLIGNAIEHMGSCAHPRISVDVEELGDAHRLRVSDAGRGIPREQHERIFEIYHTASESTRRRGTGMGLAIVRRIAEAHGGRAWVESEPGRGATFYVTLAKN
jgi:signal transduction histidine kinase